jgi:hypothetical protein
MSTFIEIRIPHYEKVTLTYTGMSNFICEQLGMSREELFWMQVDKGSDYIRRFTLGWQQAFDEVSQFSYYWAWFLNHWYKMDEDFVREFDLTQIAEHGKSLGEATRIELLNQYEAMHDLIFNPETKPGRIAELGYCGVMEEFIKKQLHERT